MYVVSFFKRRGNYRLLHYIKPNIQHAGILPITFLSFGRAHW